MLKEVLSKFGKVKEGNKESGIKESYIVELEGLKTEEKTYVEVQVEESDLVSINNKHYPITIDEEKEAYLSSLFDEEYTITKENNLFSYEVKTKGTYFPTLYLDDIKTFYTKYIETFGNL